MLVIVYRCFRSMDYETPVYPFALVAFFIVPFFATFA